ncbi:glycosyltransferase family 61 protein [Neoroseomonas lacus]|uniref:Glycosyltransferase 61 catalytic domain-containing protein n=1 Tax=Neoroseomonas lacus TaxID=287609 RepID=A0A917KUR2_9PROT|nr:glycosyltransferase family 61 protein [Neoroseomonas lacus]GGJ28855.1 hypothetical protein GCM10011320_40120 [Neoroseomonas lacus]
MVALPNSDAAAAALQVILAKVHAAAVRGDGQAASEATALLVRRPVPPRQVKRIVVAAINLNSRDFVAVAARVAVGADMPPRIRVNIAWRLAITDFAAEALAVLLADPQILPDPRFVRISNIILAEVRNRGTSASLVTEQAEALLRRLLPTETPPFVASPYGYPGNAAAKACMLGDQTIVHVAPGLPVTILTETTEAIARFERMATTAQHPKVKMLTDVFVNRTGQIWTREGRVFRAYNRPIPPQSRAAEATARELAQAALAVESHNNIFHWLVQWFPSLAWRLGDAASDMPLLIRDEAARFLHESLELGAVSSLPIESTGDAIMVRQLHLGDPRLVLLARPGLAGPLYTRIRERAASTTPAAEMRPIYISRRDTQKRPLVNEPDLEAALAERGFDILTMSSLSFAEQVARVDAATMVVGAHGAGFALLATARPGREVVEIVPSFRGDMQIRVCMANISRIVGHRHHLWLEPMPATTAGHWSVALDPFLALIDRLRAGRA